MEFHHVSVLRQEVLENLAIYPDGIYVDCTLGGAGHACAIGEQLSKNGTLIGFDQDKDALQAAKKRLQDLNCKVETINSNFFYLKEELEKRGYNQVDGFLFDLGVSSYQLDNAERGFSYMQDGPLDMRMSDDNELTAEILVNEASEEKLVEIITKYGEERWAKRIVSFIMEERTQKRICTTSALVSIIKKAIPAKARQDGPHPAKRTFQALRIAVNKELEILETSFREAVGLLKPHGRICVITFHSLEDRITKEVFRELSKQCVCPPEIPICVCGHNNALLKAKNKPILPSFAEIEENPRSRSAKLRVGERV